MSEFYFDYKCIAMSEKRTGSLGAEDKALDFYLYQDYNNDKGGMGVQVYVPREMQKNFCGARLYFSPNAVDFPDMLDPAAPYEFFKCSARVRNDISATDMTAENSIFIKCDALGELSGCGVIAFIDGTDVNAPPKPENAYKFVINYSKKETISYSIDEYKSGIMVRVLYPLIKNDIVLRVVRKSGAKPVLISDRMGDDKFLRCDGEVVEIKLKATGRLNSAKKVRIPAEGTDSNDFRLVFADQSNNAYYLLVDESQYTLEDKEERKKNERAKRGASVTVHKCPYCGGDITPVKYTGGTLIADCGGKTLATHSPDAKLNDRHTTVCGAKLTELSNGYLTEDRLVIPDGYLRLPSMNIAVAGFPRAGKTIYLASVMNMSVNSGAVESDPFILDRILNAFDKSKGKKGADGKELAKKAEEVKFDGVDDQNALSSDCEKLRSSADEADGKVKLRYVLSVGNSVEKHTETGEDVKLSWNPVGYRMGELGFMYFYDIPGELFAMADSRKVRTMDVADCILAVIDGSLATGEALQNTRTALERIKKMATHKIDLKSMPIAIVFTKHDKKLTDYVASDNLIERGTCFDENCHVVREDMLGLMPKNGVYEGSALERHIDCSDYELKHYLKANNATDYNSIISSYDNIKFFTCSALGNDSCLMDNGYTKDVLFRPRRLRVELPLVWLMYKKGLIRK